MIGTGIGLGLAGYRINPAGFGALPALDLWFSNFKTLTATTGPTPSFSRASSGTYFDAAGLLQTASTNGARFNHTYNGANWVSRGLLIEEQRTNLHKYSEAAASIYNPGNGSFTSNVSTAPDGTLTAEKYTENTASDQHAFNMNPGSLVGTHTFSLFLKEAGRYKVAFLCQTPVQFICFDLRANTTFDASGATGTIKDVGNGWRRITVTYNSLTNYFDNVVILLPDGAGGIGARFYTGDNSSGVLVWGTQIEAAPFASSYIPNLSNGSTTRSADVMQITGTNFSSFWNLSEGSFAVEYDRLANNSSGLSGGYPTTLAAASSNNDWIILAGSIAPSPVGEVLAVYSSTSQAYFSAGSSPLAGVTAKMAACYKANDFAASLNGSTVSTDTSGTVPACDRLGIGYWPFGNAPINGHIARLRYWNTRLDNATLRALST